MTSTAGARIRASQAACRQVRGREEEVLNFPLTAPIIHSMETALHLHEVEKQKVLDGDVSEEAFENKTSELTAAAIARFTDSPSEEHLVDIAAITANVIRRWNVEDNPSVQETHRKLVAADAKIADPVARVVFRLVSLNLYDLTSVGAPFDYTDWCAMDLPTATLATVILDERVPTGDDAVKTFTAAFSSRLIQHMYSNFTLVKDDTKTACTLYASVVYTVIETLRLENASAERVHTVAPRLHAFCAAFKLAVGKKLSTADIGVIRMFPFAANIPADDDSVLAGRQMILDMLAEKDPRASAAAGACIIA